MAWTTPKTWASEPLTSIDLNTYIRDNQNYLKSRIDSTAQQYIRTSGNYTTTSSSLVDVDATNMALTITTSGKDVLVTLVGYISESNGNQVDIAVDVDGGTDVKTLVSVEGNAGENQNVSFGLIWSGLSAGSHTFKLQWARDGGGTATMRAGSLLFDVREMIGEI